MAFLARITRKTPSAFVFLVDQSGSMASASGIADENGNQIGKAQAVADALNSTLDEIVNRCQGEEPDPRNYFDVATLGYGQDNERADFVWEGALAGRQWVSVSDLKANILKVEEYETEEVIRGKLVPQRHCRNLWLNPTAVGGTPMKDAFCKTLRLLEDWIANHRASVAPVIINITDGAATDCADDKRDLIAEAEKIKALATDHNHCVLVNVHISHERHGSVVFPAAPDELPADPYARTLYAMSSEIPEQWLPRIVDLFKKDAATYKSGRAIAYNAGVAQLIKILDIGTKPAGDFDPAAER